MIIDMWDAPSNSAIGAARRAGLLNSLSTEEGHVAVGTSVLLVPDPLVLLAPFDPFPTVLSNTWTIS